MSSFFSTFTFACRPVPSIGRCEPNDLDGNGNWLVSSSANEWGRASERKFFEKNVICKLRYTEKGPMRPYVRLIEISFIYANDYSCLSSGERICILFTFRTRPSSTCVSKKSNTCVRLSIKCATTNTIHPANRPQFAIYCWHSQCSRLDCYRIQPDLGQNSASIPVSGMERKET